MVSAFCNLSDNSNATFLEMLSLTPPGNAVSAKYVLSVYIYYVLPAPH